MFTATDEEMRQIDQLMECLIKRTNQKCKKCIRFFSNEAALEQHHCETPIKKEKRLHCGKTINYANNLGKDLRNCQKAPTHTAKQQLRQTILRDAYPLSRLSVHHLLRNSPRKQSMKINSFLPNH